MDKLNENQEGKLIIYTHDITKNKRVLKQTDNWEITGRANKQKHFVQHIEKKPWKERKEN